MDALAMIPDRARNTNPGLRSQSIDWMEEGLVNVLVVLLISKRVVVIFTNTQGRSCKER